MAQLIPDCPSARVRPDQVSVLQLSQHSLASVARSVKDLSAESLFADEALVEPCSDHALADAGTCGHGNDLTDIELSERIVDIAEGNDVVELD